MTFDDAYNAIKTSIRMGISAEDDGTDGDAGDEFDNPLTPLVRSITREQIDWIASWLAGEGFRLPLDPRPWEAVFLTGRVHGHRIPSLQSAERLRMGYRFNPRSAYSQDHSDYGIDPSLIN